MQLGLLVNVSARGKAPKPVGHMFAKPAVFSNVMAPEPWSHPFIFEKLAAP